MIRTGEMVRHGGSPPMRVADIFNGMVRCIQINGRGQILQRFFREDQLTPLWLSLQPRSVWPDPGQLDEIEIAKEELAALEAKRRAKAEAKAASRKPKASKKIRRSVAA